MSNYTAIYNALAFVDRKFAEDDNFYKMSFHLDILVGEDDDKFTLLTSFRLRLDEGYFDCNVPGVEKIETIEQWHLWRKFNTPLIYRLEQKTKSSCRENGNLYISDVESIICDTIGNLIPKTSDDRIAVGIDVYDCEYDDDHLYTTEGLLEAGRIFTVDHISK